MELWYFQNYIENYQMGLKVKETLFCGKTRFQEIAILDTYLYGKTLILDGIVQTTEKDEFMYHEMLVHPAMCVHPEPRKIFIIGGGDGGASREVLKHPVEKVQLVDIDEEVIELCKRYFPELGNWEDSRLNVLVEDATQFIKESDQVFDVIIMDSTDPIPRGVAEPLFSKDFFQQVFEHLSPEGLFVSQIEPPFFEPERVRKLWENLSMFPIVKVYWGLVPTYPGGVWTYVVGSKSLDPQKPLRTPDFPTRYYSPEVHQSAFTLPVFFERLLEGKES